MTINLSAAPTHLIIDADLVWLTSIYSKLGACIDTLLEERVLLEVYLWLAHPIESLLVRINPFATSYTRT